MHEFPEIAGFGRGKLVLLVAALLGLNAIGLDIMLAALPELRRAMGTDATNLVQLTVGLFLAGAAVAAFLVGPVADAFGRRKPILLGLALFVVASALTPFATNIETLLVLRFLQGLGVGTTRLSQAVLRDRYAGSQMAEVMSLSLMAFLILPVVAPLIGQAILSAAGWQAIFFTMAGLGLGVWGWTFAVLPETLDPAQRRAFGLKAIWGGLGVVARDRNAVGYGLAAMLLLGALYGFIATAQPIYGEAYRLGGFFALAMGATAVLQSLSAFACARLIRRHGAPAIGLAALLVYAGLATALALLFSLGLLPFWLFLALVTGLMAMFTWADATLGALSMTHLGHVAGTAASAFGALQALGATLIGSLIGQLYDGTPRALVWGLLILGLGALGAVIWARGR